MKTRILKATEQVEEQLEYFQSHSSKKYPYLTWLWFQEEHVQDCLYWIDVDLVHYGKGFLQGIFQATKDYG